MANGPIRTLYMGRQAAAGAAAATRQNMYFDVATLNHTPHVGRIIPNIGNGTVMPDQFSLRGNRSSDFATRLPLMFSQIGYWAPGLVAPPVDTAGPAASTYLHFAKAGPATAPPLYTIQAYDNVEWEQLIDAGCNTGRFNLSATAIPMVDLAYVSRLGTPGPYTVSLGAPSAGNFTLTVLGQTTANIAYNAAASAVQSALVLLSTVGAGNATVTGSAGGPYTVLLALGLGTLTGSGAGLTGGTFVITSGPAAIAVPTVTWNEPADVVEQTFNLAGASASVISGTLSVENALTPFFTAQPAADMVRLKRGFLHVRGELTCDYLARAGSMYDATINGTSPGVLIFRWQDTATSLGVQATVGTTITPAITTVGPQTVAVGAATNIAAGSMLLVDTAAAQEAVLVQSISGTNMTATFSKTHLAGTALANASAVVNPLIQIEIYNVLLQEATKPNDAQERAQRVTYSAGYNVTAGTVMALGWVDGTATYAGS